MHFTSIAFESNKKISTRFWLTCISLLLFNSFLCAQPNTWVAVYGGIHYDRGKGIVQTSDKGYMICSSSSSFGSGTTNVYLFKIDSAGKYQWETTLGGPNIENASSIKQTPDSGFVISGSSNSSGAGGYDAYLVKTNSSGALQWEKTYGGSDWDFAYWAEPTNDGGYIIAGESYTAGNNSQASLIKTNSTGDTLWTKLLGVQGPDIFKEVHQTADSGFIAAGTSTSDAGDMDFYLVKTNAQGNIQWEKTFGGTGNDACYTMAASSDGGFLLGGSYDSNGVPKIYYLKTNSAGDLLLSKIDTPTTGGKYVSRIRETTDGKIITLINSDAGGLGGKEIFLDKWNGPWNIWVSTFGGAYDEEGYDLIQTTDSGFALVGYTDTYSIGPDNNIFVAKTDKNGSYNSATSNYVGTDNLLSENENITLYPNPTSGRFKTESANAKIQSLKIYTLQGGLVVFNAGKSDHSESDITHLPNGMYLVEIKTKEGVIRKKIILSK